MAFLSDEEKQEISAAIKKAESKTSGELVTVIARRADAYLYIPILWAALVALVFPAETYFMHPEMDALTTYKIQLLLFISISLVLRWTPLKMALIPKGIKHHRASRLAREQFFAQGLYLTREHTGVLIFVSIAERYVEIIADSGIHQKVEADAWDAIVGHFVNHVKTGDIARGFLIAIEAVGDKLARHFPRPQDDTNELPDRLIEI